MKTVSINQLGLVCVAAMMCTTACFDLRPPSRPLSPYATTNGAFPGPAKEGIAAAPQGVGSAPSTATEVKVGNPSTAAGNGTFAGNTSGSISNNAGGNGSIAASDTPGADSTTQTGAASGIPVGATSRRENASATTSGTSENDSTIQTGAASGISAKNTPTEVLQVSQGTSSHEGEHAQENKEQIGVAKKTNSAAHNTGTELPLTEETSNSMGDLLTTDSQDKRKKGMFSFLNRKNKGGSSSLPPSPPPSPKSERPSQKKLLPISRHASHSEPSSPLVPRKKDEKEKDTKNKAEGQNKLED